MPAGVQRTVPCDERIDTTPFPYLGNSQRQQRYRSVLFAGEHTDFFTDARGD
jgi:hypothetical protein